MVMLMQHPSSEARLCR